MCWRVGPGFLLAGMLLSWGELSQAIEPQVAKEPVSIKEMIEVNTPTEAGISPNGRWVAYVSQKGSINDNNYVRNIFVVAADGSTNNRQLTHNEPRGGLWASAETISAVWAPTSDKLAYVARRGDRTELRSIDIKSGAEKVIISSEVLGENVSLAPDDFQGITVAYSPNGKSVAFLAATSIKSGPPAQLLRGIDADEDWSPADAEQPFPIEPVSQLYVLDLDTQRIQKLTSLDFHVVSFAWSPEGRRFAVEAIPDPLAPARWMRSDIFVVPASGGKLEPVVQLEGIDRSPVWSPDGTQIAFCSQFGKPNWGLACSLAVVDANGRNPPRGLGNNLDQIAGSSLDSIQWTSDGSNIDVVSRYHLGKHLFRVSAKDGTVRRLSDREDRVYDNVTYSANGKIMAMRIQGVGVPADLYISSRNHFLPKPMTHLNPSWDGLSVPKTEIVRWRSSDNRWDIHGLLIEPSNYDPKLPSPMLTAVIGGPGMVLQELNPDSSYPILALAEKGYVIFMPNSRGRGGFGSDFLHAIRDEQSYVLNPVADVLAGVDAMVARGVADTKKLGIMGFSYGGTLTAYAITETARFKAAIYGEGTPDFFRWYDYPSAAVLPLGRDLQGFGNPYEPTVIASGFEQSSLYRASLVHTPVLVEAGESSGWKTDRAYFRGLQHFQIPSEFYVYPRSGHGWDEPKLLEDSYSHHIAWLDYWVLDRPYPDAEKQKRFDGWKRGGVGRVN